RGSRCHVLGDDTVAVDGKTLANRVAFDVDGMAGALDEPPDEGQTRHEDAAETNHLVRQGVAFETGYERGRESADGRGRSRGGVQIARVAANRERVGNERSHGDEQEQHADG